VIIRRQTRPETNYYVLDKSISEDPRLSWAARGMLVYLLGKPDNWEVSVSHLIKQTEGSGKHSRRDAVYGLLKEIEVAGYITRVQQRKEGGGFEPVNYVVSEVPLTENPEASNQATDTENTAVTENTEAPLTENPDAPLPGSPDTGQPYTANPTLTSNEKTVSNDSQQVAIPIGSGEPRPKPVGQPPCPQTDILALYHELLPELRRHKVWAGKRESQLRARWREDPKRQSLDYWRRFFGYVRKSRFLMGLAEPMTPGGAPFQADLEFLTKADKFANVIEGKYHGDRAA